MTAHINNFKIHLDRGGLVGAKWWTRKQYHRLKPENLDGRNVFDSEWDLLVIIDGCDIEWTREVVSEQSLFDEDDLDSIVSVGSGSDDWHENTFEQTPPHVLEDTAFITGNPFVEAHKPPSLGFLENVKEWGWEESLGAVPAHNITDAAIDAGRTTNFERYVVHYMQPHAPFIERTDPDDRRSVELAYPAKDCREPWYQVMRGDLSSDRLRQLYIDNLRYVLQEVDLLCRNFAAERAVLSADHGNGVGDDGLYGHPARVPIKKLRQVPWISLTASNEETVRPSIDRTPTGISREDQLSSLGYL